MNAERSEKVVAFPKPQVHRRFRSGDIPDRPSLAVPTLRHIPGGVGTMRSIIQHEGVNGCDQPISRHAPIAVR